MLTKCKKCGSDKFIRKEDSFVCEDCGTECSKEEISILANGDIATEAEGASGGQPKSVHSGSSSLPVTEAFSHDDQGQGALEKRPQKIGDYVILKELSRGGMGVVYKARQVRLNRVVALKTILPDRRQTPELEARFRQEAEAAGRLDHPGIVPVYEIGDAEGLLYYSMAYVDGEDLARRRVSSRDVPHSLAAQWLVLIADAISEAHAVGILHRDLKPQNILLDEHEQPRITDFGLAKMTTSSEDLTIQGMVLGTPNYMPPEQARGELDKLNECSDVYSLGAVLYFLLTGRPPFQASTSAETLHQVLTNDPISPRRIDPTIDLDLDTICMKCLEKDPQRRYASASELRDELERYLKQEPIQARPISSIERMQRWARRNPRVAVLSTLVATSLLLGTIVSTGFALEANRQAVLKEKEAATAVSEAAKKEKARQEAVKAQAEAEASARVANEQAELALTTLSSAVFDVQTQLGRKPETRELRIEMLKELESQLQQVAVILEESDIGSMTKCQIHLDLGELFEAIGLSTSNQDWNSAIYHYALATKAAREYHNTAPEDDQGVVNLIASLSRLAERQIELGKLQHTEQLLNEGRELLPFLPQSTNEWNTAYARTLLLRPLALLAIEKGQWQAARDYITESLQLEPLVESNTTSEYGTLFRRQYYYGDLVRANLGLGDSSQALRRAQERLKIALRLLELQPTRAESQEAAGRSYIDLADISFASDDFDIANDYYHQAEQHFRKQREYDPQSLTVPFHIAQSLSMQGAIHNLRNRPVESLPLLREAYELRKVLFEKQPENAELAANYLIAVSRLANCHLLLKNRTNAADKIIESHEIAERLMESETLGASTRQTALDAIQLTFTFLYALGSYELGRPLLDFVEIQRAKLVEQGVLVTKNKRQLVSTRLYRAQELLDGGRWQEARELLVKALADHDSLVGKQGSRPVTPPELIERSRQIITALESLDLEESPAELARSRNGDGQRWLYLRALIAAAEHDFPTVESCASLLKQGRESLEEHISYAVVCAELDRLSELHLNQKFAGEDNARGITSRMQARAWRQEVMSTLNKISGDATPQEAISLGNRLFWDDRFSHLREEQQFVLVLENAPAIVKSFDEWLKLAAREQAEASSAAKAGELGDAARHYEEARTAIEQALVVEPANELALERKGYILYRFADVLSSMDDPRSVEIYSQAAEVWEALIGLRENAFDRSQLGGILNNIAIRIDDDGKVKEASKLLRRAIELQEEALAMKPSLRQAKMFLQIHLRQVQGVERQLGNFEQALDDLDRMAGLNAGTPQETLNTAIKVVQCMEEIDADKQLDRERREQLLAKGDRLVIAMFKRNMSQGMKLSAIRGKQAFAFLLKRPAFKEAFAE